MKLGFIGLGGMGRPMAQNLIQAGHELVVYNRTRSRTEPFEEQGARVVDVPSLAATGVDAVVTMLSDDAAVEQAVLGEQARSTVQRAVQQCGKYPALLKQAQAASTHYLAIRKQFFTFISGLHGLGAQTQELLGDDQGRVNAIRFKDGTQLATELVVMAVGTENKAVLATCVVVAGLFIGINNTLITETVMKAAPVERGVASAAYSFVRFSGAAMAPWLAGVLGEQISVHLPFWVGAAAVLLGAGVLFASRRHLVGIDVEDSELDEITEQATAITVGSDS